MSTPMRRYFPLLALLLVGINTGYSEGRGAVLRSDTTQTITPRKALIYSALCPGLGQIYVKRPFKAALVFTAEGYHLYQFNHYKTMYGYITRTQDKIGRDVWSNLTEAQKKDSVTAYTGHRLDINTWRVREKRNKYAWWCVAIYLLGILDAYVDAHLYYFPTDKVELSYRPLSNFSGKSNWTWTIAWRM